MEAENIDYSGINLLINQLNEVEEEYQAIGSLARGQAVKIVGPFDEAHHYGRIADKTDQLSKKYISSSEKELFKKINYIDRQTKNFISKIRSANGTISPDNLKKLKIKINDAIKGLEGIEKAYPDSFFNKPSRQFKASLALFKESADLLQEVIDKEVDNGVFFTYMGISALSMRCFRGSKSGEAIAAYDDGILEFLETPTKEEFLTTLHNLNEHGIPLNNVLIKKNEQLTHAFPNEKAKASLNKNIQPLLAAVLLDHPESLDFLSDFVPPSKKDKILQNSLFTAASLGYTNIIEVLAGYPYHVNLNPKSEDTPLNLAVMSGEVEAVHTLIKLGADVNLPDAFGNKVTPLLTALLENNLIIAKILIENKADPNLSRRDGHSPLTFAVSRGNLEMIEFLIDNGADINLIAEQGCTPLIYATMMYSTDIKLIKFLVSNGADINKSDPFGNTPLDFAVIKDDVFLIELLVELGAIILPSNVFKAVKHSNLEALKKLKELGPEVSVLSGEDKSLLLPALAYDKAKEKEALEVMDFLLDRLNPDEFIIKNKLVTPLQLVARNGNFEAVKMLIAHGANPNLRIDGATVFQKIVQAGVEPEILQYLIDNGADVNSIDKAGLTASYYADLRSLEILLKYENKSGEQLLQDKMIAHRFSLDLQGEFNGIPYLLEGFPSGMRSPWLLSLNQSFLEFYNRNSELILEADPIFKTLTKAEKQQSQSSAELIQELEEGGNTLFLLTGTSTHATCDIILDHLYIQANRGSRGRDRHPGFIIYEITKPLTVEILDEIRRKDLKSLDHLEKDVLEKLGLVGLMSVSLAEQKSGNCSFISPKTGLASLFLLLSVQEKTHKPVTHKDYKLFGQIWTEKAQGIYKKWSTFDKEYAVSQLLDSYTNRKVEDPVQPNLDLLLFVFARFKGSQELRQKMYDYLLENGINWNAEDISGNKVTEYIKKNPKAVSFLRKNGIEII